MSKSLIHESFVRNAQLIFFCAFSRLRLTMNETTNNDVMKVLGLAVVLVGILIGLCIWNQQSHVLDPLATQVYSVFVSR